MKGLTHIMLAGVLLVFAGCFRRVYVPDADEARTLEYEAGSPSFAMEAVARIEGVEAGIRVYVAIPYVSLVFVRAGDEFSAVYEAVVTVRADSDISYQDVWTDTVSVGTYEATQQFENVVRSEWIALAPGRYTIEIALEAAESGARAVRRQDVTVTDPASNETAVSELLLEASRSGRPFEPVVSVHVPGAYDSLRAVAELYNVPEPADVTFLLVRFRTDTTVATPPYWFMPAPFTLTYMGVDYQSVDTVQVSTRRIIDAADLFAIEFAMADLRKGTYAALIQVSNGERDAVRRRYFTVKSPTFPRITELTEMVHALRYVARDDEMEYITAAPSREEMKRRFDAFWADRVPNRQAAASLLELYYSRVEQANVLFSGHKEGWKTDRGMLYVVFGPPAYVEDYAVRKEWYYFEQGAVLSRRLPPFVFRRSMAYGYAGLFDNFVLVRREGYEDDWRRKLESWRDGTVL